MKKLTAVLLVGWLACTLSAYAEPVAMVGQAVAEPIKIEVYRSASCSCCGKWISHLQDNHFQVQSHIVDDVQPIKAQYGVPKEMASCHTALVNGYVIEGHVPANDIRKLLKLKPQLTGIAAPGMPTGSPGMEMGNKKDAYDVISFDKEKHFQVFTHYESKP